MLKRYGVGLDLPLDADLENIRWIPSDDRFAVRRSGSDRKWIETFAFNNNRGDYADRKRERIVTEFVDNALDGERSIVHFGYALGAVVDGFEYVAQADLLAFKTAAAKCVRPYIVPESMPRGSRQRCRNFTVTYATSRRFRSGSGSSSST